MPIVSDYTALLPDHDWARWNGAGPDGSVTYVSYSFLTGSDVPDPATTPGLVTGANVDYQALDSLRQTAVRDAIAEFEAVSGLRFIEVDDPEDALIKFTGNHSDSLTSWASYPFSTTSQTSRSLVVLTEDEVAANRDDTDWDRGGSMFTLTLHEIGHAVGLEHTHHGTVLDDAYDSHEYSVMSYDWSWSGQFTSGSWQSVDELRSLDVAALRHVYGDASDFGDDWVADWDAWGRVFTLTGSNTEDDTLYGIAADSVIDGRGGDDLIAGRMGDDTLRGSAGNDSLYGNEGDDVLVGGGGDDLLDGGFGDDTISYLSTGEGITANLTSSAAQVVATSQGSDTFRSIENLWATRFDDDVTGSNGDNTLIGYGGDDTFNGMWGDDTIWGDQGDDVFIAYGGDDVYYGGTGRDRVDFGQTWGAVSVDLSQTGAITANANYGSDALHDIEDVSGSAWSDTLTDNGMGNTLDGRGGNDTLTGADGNDTLLGGAGNDSLLGGAGNDSLDGGDGRDTLEGGAGNDTLSAVAGASQINGGDGLDTFDMSAWSTAASIHVGATQTDIVLSNVETLIGTGLSDALSAGSTAMHLRGGAGDDTLNGGAGNDTLNGGLGADQLNGGAGDDAFVIDASDDVDGGAGRDTLYLSGLSDAVFVSLADGTVQIGAHSASVSGIEVVVGSAQDDTLSGSDQADRLQGGAGNDRLVVTAGADTLNGDEGTDTLAFDGTDDLFANLNTGRGLIVGTTDIFQSSGIEHISGGAGDDRLFGDNGDNRLSGGDGDDTIWAGGGSDTVDGGAGNDTFSAYWATGSAWISMGLLNLGMAVNGGLGTISLKGIETIYGSARFGDSIYTGGGNDRVFGFGGDDFIICDFGSDTIHGGAGNDRIYGAHGFNYTKGTGSINVGTDYETVVNGGAGNDTVYGGSGDDTLMGGAGNDLLQATWGTDQLWGGAENDTLRGGDDNAILHGGMGADLLVGGEDTDWFVFDHVAQSRHGAQDRIEGFDRAVDLILLNGIDADTGTTGDQAFRIQTGGWQAAGDLRLIEIDGDTFVYADVDGDARADFSVRVNGVTGLDASDFLL